MVDFSAFSAFSAVNSPGLERGGAKEKNAKIGDLVLDTFCR